jgi:hypothetical protein
MPLTINNTYFNTPQTLTDKLNNLYKKNVDEKTPILKNSTNPEIAKMREVKSNDIRQYLTVDEKKVLKEVFNEEGVDGKTTTPYQKNEYTEFMKGTQLDVKL